MADSLSWQHRLNAELLRVAWPIAVSMLSHGAMSLVDTLFVARLGTSALAAVGLGGVMAFYLVCFAFGLLRAVKVAVSQAVGAGQADSITPLVGAGLWLAATLGVLFGGAGWIAAPAFADLTLDGHSSALAAEYMRVRALGTPAFLVWVALSEARYGLGASRLPMIAVVLGNGLNIGLTALFVLGLGWGVEGAAWATVLGNSLTASVLVGAQLRPGLGLKRARWCDLSRLWRLGIPLGVQFVVESSAFVLLVGIIAQFGETELAAHEVVLQLCHFIFLPTMAVGDAGSVLVGQAVGANQDELVRRVSHRTWWAALAYSVACSTVFVLFPRSLARAFTNDPGLIQVVEQLLLCAAVFQVFHASNIVARSTLRGTGDVTYPAVVSVALAWVVTPPLAWWLGGTLGFGALGGWIGLALEVAGGTILLWRRLERGGWKLAAARSRVALVLDPAVSCQESAFSPERS